MTELTIAVASGGPQPQTTFRALERLVVDTVGVKLFTLMELDHARGVAWRSYSNRPDAYPVSGEKPIQQNAWSEIVERRQQMFVANSIEEIAAVFADYELIQQLGCESCLNIPVVIAGRVRGTLNCLHDAGHYTPQRVASAESLKLPGALAFLLAAELRTTEEIT